MQQKLKQADMTRFDSLTLPVKVIFVLMALVGVCLAVFYVFGIKFFGYPLQQWAYYYLVIAIFGGAAFVIIPARKGTTTLPWYDVLAAVLMLGIGIYFSTNSTEIMWGKWSTPSTTNMVLGGIMILLVLDMARRVAGNFFFILCIILAVYPIFAENLPGLLGGRGFSFERTLGALAFSDTGIVGIPTGVMANLLLGFLLFAGFLIACGAGDFFLKLALVLLGKYRGGPAKVAVVSSCFFGSLSGAAIANIVATGSFTIPTMKRLGYPAHYAGAIETVASVGGALMPPVMGATAFVMAQLLGIEYSLVIISAFIPALMYYFGLLMQVDAYAARVGMVGLPQAEIPSVRETLAEGWHFILVLLFLVFGLLYMRWEAMTPYYATVLLVVLSFFRKETMMTPRRLVKTFATTGVLLAQTVAMILPIGFVLNGLIITGLSGAFSSSIVAWGGDNLIFVLLLGVIACYIMGMAGLVVEAYIFLAITLAPALIKIADFNPIAVHMFLLYFSNLGMLTPPVAVAAFVGAAIANAKPMQTAVKAMSLGIVLYFIPFFFLFNPSLIFQGEIIRTLYLVPLIIIGITLIAAGLEGYLLKVGSVPLWARPVLVAAGFAICLPEWLSTIGGAIVAVIVIAMVALKNRKPALPIVNT